MTSFVTVAKILLSLYSNPHGYFQQQNAFAEFITTNGFYTVKQWLCHSVQKYTVSHKKWSQLIFVSNFVKNQQILMQFSPLELMMNDTCNSMNFTTLPN